MSNELKAYYMAMASVIAIVCGATFIGCAFGWKVGVGIGLIGWGLKPTEGLK